MVKAVLVLITSASPSVSVSVIDSAALVSIDSESPRVSGSVMLKM